MAHLDGYLSLAIQRGASDLHFSANQPVRMRIDGDLTTVDATVLNSDQVQHIFWEILTDAEKEKFLQNLNLDRSYSIEGIGNFRVNIFMTRVGVAAVLRSIPSKIPTIEELGLPDSLKELASSASGLVLVTGPTGSGKSTTLAAMIHHINRSCPYHILTAEDPVEFVHPSIRSLVNQREIGASCPSFADALKFALREDPDVILVGEMRDLETISLALTAAETGHLVFGTLHTRGAAASVDRIIDSFPANQQSMIRAMLSESLVAVISQILLKRATGRGRVAAYEIMVVNHAISNLIREGKTFQITTALQTGKKEGMILMDQHIRDLVASGQVAYEEAEAVVENASILAGLSRGPGKQNAPARPGIPGRPPGALPSPPLMGGGVKPPAMGPKPPGVPGTASPAPGGAGFAPPPQPPAAPQPPGRGFSPQPLSMGENIRASVVQPRPVPPGAASPSAPAASTGVMTNSAEEDSSIEFSVSLEEDEPSAVPAAAPTTNVMPPAPPGLKKKAG